MAKSVPFIGRRDEINQVNYSISQSQDTNIIFIGGTGGIGKSRLLREIYSTLPFCGDSPSNTQIIDFDNLTFATPENVRHKMCQMFSQDVFTDYFVTEKDYQKIQTSDVSPEALRIFRKKVDDTFAACFNSATANKRMVLYFDTTDKLSKSHEVTRNLLAIIPDLKNTVVLFAGRNARDFHAWFQDRLTSKNLLLLELKPFSENESQRYLEEKANLRHVIIEETLAEKLIFLTKGTPILLDLAVDWRARGISLKWVDEVDIPKLKVLEDQTKQRYFAEFHQQLVDNVRHLRSPMDRLILMMAHVYPIDLEMLQTIGLFEANEQEIYDEAKEYSFVKCLPDQSLSLHDVMRDMINQYVWPNIPAEDDRRRWYSQNALKYFESKIKHLEDDIDGLKRQTEQTQNAADKDQHNELLTKSEGKRQQLWIIREQFLKHMLICNIDASLNVFVNIYEDASSDLKVAFRSQYINLVEEKRAVLSDKQKAILDYYKADQLFSQDQFDAARIITEELLKQDSMSPELKINCIKLRGNIRIRQGEVDEAIDDFKHATTLSEPYPELKIVCTNALGWAYRLQGNPEKAVNYYTQAKRLYHSLTRPEQNRMQTDYGLILNNMAVVLAQDSETRKAAINMANTAIQHWKTIDNRLGLAKGYLAQGICYHHMDHTDLALSAYQNALDIFEPLGLKDWIAQILSWRGSLYHNINRNEEAERDLKRSLNIGPGHIKAMSLNRLGRVYMTYKKWDEAQTYMENSLELAKEVPDYKYWMMSISRLILIAAKKGQVGQLDYFRNLLDECLAEIKDKIDKPDENAEGVANFGLALIALLQNCDDKIPLIVNWLEKGISNIVLYGSYARMDITKWLETIEEDFGKIKKEIVRKVGGLLFDIFFEKEVVDINYSTALDKMFQWQHWKEDSQ